ncbi:MAG TPA: hypothetical protein VD886_09295 [Herpetosiphonaceae bacterium]|nr:hypothetical protein [Herpetosiphonaceae bacterium]
MSDKTEELVHPHDLEPDPEPDEIPTAILEEDEDAPPGGMTLQTIAFGLGIFLIILLVLFIASGGRVDLISRIWPWGKDPNVNVNTPLAPIVNGTGGAINNSAGAGANGTYYGVDGLGTLPSYSASIDPLLLPYWVRNGGEPIFGRPISPLLEENGRKFQWFERARLELWPEFAGTKYEIQPGRIGIEFTKGIDFPTQEFFVNRSGLQYAEVTQHGLRGAFLEFWEKNGGVDVFGYPISDELQEVLPEDESYHTVQYFERARFELHQSDPNQPIKLGLLGTGLYKQDSKPELQPVKPTQVPITP